MIGEHTGQLRLEICPDSKRGATTLMGLIKKNVAPETVIVTDCWAAYNKVEENGYYHLKVNHSYQFVDPDTAANTQKIEASWGSMKKKLKKRNSSRKFGCTSLRVLMAKTSQDFEE